MSLIPGEQELVLRGLPDHIEERDAAACRSRIFTAVQKLLEASHCEQIDLRVMTTNITGSTSLSSKVIAAPTEEHTDNEFNVEQRAKRYAASDPLWGLDYLIVPQAVKEELLLAIGTIRLEPLVFDTWGLRAIEPFPRSALNFHGAPGTGKTLAAHGVAAELGTKILVASYAQIESMYHGEGPKNVEALFNAAQHQGAVLFIDEADSLLSRRLTNVTQGSEQAINSMRSQLLICLEKYRGVVIFATNLVSNYDPAFETRVRHVHFPMPDSDAREAIWRKHLPGKLPLAQDVDVPALAHAEEVFCGRDIKNAVVNAAMQTARQGSTCLCQQDLLQAICRIVDARNALRIQQEVPAPEDMKDRIRHAVAVAKESDAAFSTAGNPG